MSTNSPFQFHPIPSDIDRGSHNCIELLPGILRQATSPTVLVMFTAVRSYRRRRCCAVSGMHVDLPHIHPPRPRIDRHVIQHLQDGFPVLLRVPDSGDQLRIPQRILLAILLHSLMQVGQRERLQSTHLFSPTVTNVSVFVPTSTTGCRSSPLCVTFPPSPHLRHLAAPKRLLVAHVKHQHYFSPPGLPHPPRRSPPPAHSPSPTSHFPPTPTSTNFHSSPAFSSFRHTTPGTAPPTNFRANVDFPAPFPPSTLHHTHRGNSPLDCVSSRGD